MGWEERSGNLYYYTKRRTADGRVVSEYVGTGPVADLVAQSDEVLRETAAIRRMERRQRLAPIDEALNQLKNLQREVRLLVKANLLATGHHTHKGQWRRRRAARPTDTDHEHPTDVMAKSEKHDPAPAEGGAETPDPHITPSHDGTYQMNVTEKEADDETLAMLRRCDSENPSKKDVKALKAWLRSGPHPYRRVLNIAAVSLDSVLKMGASESVLVRELARTGLEEFQDSLGIKTASPLERVLIEQVGVSWLVLQNVQRRYGNAVEGSYRLSLAEHYEKRLSAAQRRFNKAVETLERVRKMRRRGPVQVNVAAAGGTIQQVNTSP